MWRLSRYQASNIHAPGVTCRGTLGSPTTTIINVAKSATNWVMQAQSADQPQEPPVKQQQKHTTNKQPSNPTHTVVATMSDSDKEEFDNKQLSVHKTSSRHSNAFTWQGLAVTFGTGLAYVSYYSIIYSTKYRTRPFKRSFRLFSKRSCSC